MRWLEITAAAAIAAKSLQSCPTLCDPIDGSPPGSPVPGILQARTLEWVAIAFSNAWKWKVKVKSLSHVRLLATPWTAAHQASPSMGLSRQEYWSGVPLPSLRNHWMCSSRNHDNTSEMLRAVGGVFHQVASGISSNFKTSGNPRDRGAWWAAVSGSHRARDDWSDLAAGNFLAVQWLGLLTLTAEGLDSIPGLGTKIPQAKQHSQKNWK